MQFDTRSLKAGLSVPLSHFEIRVYFSAFENRKRVYFPAFELKVGLKTRFRFSKVGLKTRFRLLKAGLLFDFRHENFFEKKIL